MKSVKGDNADYLTADRAVGAGSPDIANEEDHTMRIAKAFVLGAIMGAAVVWLWGREVKEYVEQKARGLCTKTAEGVRAVEE